MKRYFICYELPEVKASFMLEGSEKELDKLVSDIDLNMWTEVSWFEYWFYRIARQ